MTSRIPRVDLRDFSDPVRRAEFVSILGQGLRDTGFVIIANHGIDSKLCAEAYDLFKSFFALPEELKKKYSGSKGGARGYTPFGMEHAKDSEFPDLKEFWHVGQELPAGHRLRAYYPDNLWPTEFPRLREVALNLYKAYESCARTLLQAIALNFELPENTFADMIREGNSVHRIIHYPPIEGEVPPGWVRAAAHEDINLITLLIESRGGGLEILTREGDWLPVNALEGDLIVDSGDMLSRVTNGVIPATTHRVVNPAGTVAGARYSMPFFVHPYADCSLAVMDCFVDEDLPAQWPPITADEFLTERLIEIGLLKV